MLVYPDVAGTWPGQLLDVVNREAETAPETEYTSDLELAGDADELVRSALAEHKIVAYHATRLLDHEVRWIRERGIRVFSHQLFDDRIHGADEAGAIADAQRGELLAGHMFAGGEDNRRGERDYISLTVGRQGLGEGGWNLLAHRGGEGIYFAGGT